MKPHTSKPGLTEPLPSEAGRPLNVSDALSYLDTVKIQFAKRPEVYNQFLDIMKNFRNHRIDTPGVIDRVSKLFNGNPHLIQGFTTFLPVGYQIEVSGDPSDPNTITVTTPQGTMTKSTNGTVISPRPPSDSQALLPPGQPSQQSTQVVAAASFLGNLHGRQAPLPANAISTQIDKDGNRQRNLAIQYLNKVKLRYSDDPETYQHFLNIMGAYNKDTTPASEVQVSLQVQQLFKDAPELLAEFMVFFGEVGGPTNGIDILPQPSGSATWGGVPAHSDEARVGVELSNNLVSMSISNNLLAECVGQQTKETITWLSDTLLDQAKRKALFELRGHRAQSLIDCLNHYISLPEFRQAAEPWLLKHTVIALRKLCEVSMLYPTCYVLSGVQDICPQSGGGFCDISQGRYKGQLICLKVVRLYQKSKIEDLLRAHAREAILWSQLDHPNIVPFNGIFYLERKERICLVSPWMENGHIVEYLERVPDAPRKPFVYDIVNGLQYLHAQNIVHGDLKGHNVLIDNHQNACLADFGLSTVVTDETLGFVKTTVSASGHTTRWASPELLEDDARHTRESDVWAFGCVCYEVLTGLSPFAGCSDFKALSKLMRGELPARLDNARLDTNEYLDEMLRELVGRCWSIEAKQRPGCLEILRQLEKALGPRFRSSTTQRDSGHPRFRFSDSDEGGSASASTSTSTLTTGMKRDRSQRNLYADERPRDIDSFFSASESNQNLDSPSVSRYIPSSAFGVGYHTEAMEFDRTKKKPKH